MVAKILVEISTKNRDSILGRHFAALLCQEFEDWDLLIINDGDTPVGSSQTTQYLLEKIEGCGHRVIIRDGSHISQAHNHNMALYEYPEYKYIYRSDDDILENSLALSHLVSQIERSGAGAVGGLWFEGEWQNEVFHDGAVMNWTYTESPETAGKVGPLNSNWQQRMYYDGNIEVEHLYSNCIYDAEAMREAGGWPEVYSKGVAHGEETDGTYRLFLSGKKLYVEPRATGQHLKASGGIRSARNVGKAQSMDNLKWRSRLPKIKEINFRPTVAMWCQHSYGLGGAQRQFYRTVSLLQSKTGLTIHPIFTGEYYTPEQCQETFGFTYKEYTPLDRYDVCVVFGHQPITPIDADRYILYCFFPDDTEYSFDSFQAFVGNSKYTAHWIEEKYGYKSRYIYPSVRKIIRKPGQKDNIILCVSRGDPNKAPLWLMEKFVEFDLKGWDFALVMATTGGIFYQYEDQIRKFAAEHDNVHLYEDVDNKSLENMYNRAKILWAAKGVFSKHNPSAAEHFGLTPIEAYSAGCIPVVYDAGGYKETVYKDYRWETEEDLLRITKWIIEEGHPLGFVPVNCDVYNEDDYVSKFERIIRQVNALAIQQERVEHIQVVNKKIRVAAIADSPFLTTGFGIVANQVYKKILEQDDMELCVLGIMDRDRRPPFEKLPYAFYPVPGDDLQAHKILPDFIKWANPDVIWELYDPGNAMGHVMTMKMLGQNYPWVVYFPIEGRRISGEVLRLVEAVDYPVTYCNAGRREIEQFTDKKVYVGYHGADHADFKPLDPQERAKLRKLVGWDDKFVIFNANTNKRVKQQPYLIEALAILLGWGHDDIYLYLHTRPFDDHIMQGWNLEWITKYLDVTTGLPVSDHVLFPMKFANKWKGLPFRYDDKLSTDVMTTPPTPEMRAALFNGLDFITRYGLADIYVDVSSAEGWGLGVLEGVACGLPAITVNDGMARTEVHSKYCYMIDPVHWTTWHTGSLLSLVDPMDVAEAILEVREFGTGKSNTVMEDLPWEKTTSLFVDLIRDAYHTKET